MVLVYKTNKMKIFIITGAPNTRKSSVIRALTGVRDTKTFDVQFENIKLKTHVVVVSSNEIVSKKFPKGMDPNQLVNYIKNLGNDVGAIILPLRSVKPALNLPEATEYIEILLDNGFDIQPVAMFNDEISLPKGVMGDTFYSTESNPSNLTASKLRKLWGIL